MKTIHVTNKAAYVFVAKWLPILGTFLIMVHYIAILFGHRTIIIDYIADTSLFAWLFTYISSRLFFCRLHRHFVCFIGIASLDCDLHHWFNERLFHPDWIVPVVMIMIAASLILIATFRKFDCENEK